MVVNVKGLGAKLNWLAVSRQSQINMTLTLTVFKWLILFKEIIAVYRKNHMKIARINTLCSQNTVIYVEPDGICSKCFALKRCIGHAKERLECLWAEAIQSLWLNCLQHAGIVLSRLYYHPSWTSVCEEQGDIINSTFHGRNYELTLTKCTLQVS
jgi:hypothetical protein